MDRRPAIFTLIGKEEDMRWKTVLFDLDGTLIDSLEDLTDSLNIVLAATGYPTHSPEEVRLLIGRGVRRLIEQALPGEDPMQPVERLAEAFGKVYGKKLLDKTQPFPGIVEVVSALNKAGIKIGVVTNKQQKAAETICDYFFPGQIDVVIGNQPGTARKPDPMGTYRAMEELQSQPDETVFVGDSTVDVETAVAAGVTCIAVSWGYHSMERLLRSRPSFIVNDSEELLDIIQGRHLPDGQN